MSLSLIADILQIIGAAYGPVLIVLGLLSEACLAAADRCGKIPTNKARIAGIAFWRIGVALDALRRFMGAGTSIGVVRKKFVPRPPRS